MNKYSYIKIVLAIFSVALLFLGVSQVVVADNNSVHLRFGQTIKTQGMTIRFVDVSDGRCPADVQCIWAGGGIVYLTVQSGLGEMKEIELKQSMGTEYIIVEAKKFQLKTVKPYPRTDRDYEDSDYRVVLEITDHSTADVVK